MQQKIKLIATFIIIFFIPSFFLVAFSSASLAAGLGIAAIVVLILNYQGVLNFKVRLKSLLRLLAFSLLILLPSLYSYFVENDTKPFSSFLLIMFVVASASIFSKYFFNLNSKILINTILAFILCLIFLGWLKLFFTPACCNYTLYSKPVFPFAEESHFGLCFGMLAVAYSFVGKLKWSLFILINCVALALIYPSLILLVFAAIILISLSTRFKPKLFKVAIIIISIFGILVVPLVNQVEYFSSRLNFDDSKNLTALVFLQGWELAYLNFVNSNGLGHGFQTLGSDGIELGQYTDKIVAITNRNQTLNASDGGFLAAKVIAEFGIIGLICTLYYLYWLIGIMFKVNRMNKFGELSELDKKKVLAYGFLFGFLVEVFLRGYGYFSPGLYMVVVCTFYLSNPVQHSQQKNK